MTTDWSTFYDGLLTTTEMVHKLQTTLVAWMDECFPFKYIRRRSNEAPWITEGIRRKIQMRLAIFKRDGRSRKWKRLNKHIQKLIKKKKKE